jgi:hypothetical protein
MNFVKCGKRGCVLWPNVVRHAAVADSAAGTRYIMKMTQRSMISFTLLLTLGAHTICLAQNIPKHRMSHKSADALIKSALGMDHEVGGIFDVDRILAMPRLDPSVAYIREDPNHQLQHTFVVDYTKWDSMPPQERYASGASLNDTGGIAFIRDDKLVWRSERFILDYSPMNFQVSGFADLNGDGTTDIIVSTFEGDQREQETLWLISPDSPGGRILNTVDQDGRSTIVAESGSFQFINSRSGKAKVIQSGDATFEWNGSVFIESTSRGSTHHK